VKPFVLLPAGFLLFQDQAAMSKPTKLETALKTAVAAAAAAEKHAAEIGYTVRFTPSDIRAMGISVLTAMDRDQHAA
jgi:hypothetical protein